MDLSKGWVPLDESLTVDADRILRPLCKELDVRLSLLSNGNEELLDLLRRRLLSKLSATERGAAAKRRAVLAGKFVSQRGLCACGATLGACVRTGRALPNKDALRCKACEKAVAAARPRSSAGAAPKYRALARAKILEDERGSDVHGAVAQMAASKR